MNERIMPLSTPLARGSVAQSGTGVPVVFQSTEIVNMGA